MIVRNASIFVPAMSSVEHHFQSSDPMKLLDDAAAAGALTEATWERVYETSDRRTWLVIDDRENGGSKSLKPEDEGRPCRPSDSILDALDVEDAEGVDIVFERPVSHPRPATFD